MGTFAKVFQEAVDKLERDAHDVGLNLTSICRETKTSRATPDRWRRSPPKTVQLLDEMQTIVEKKRAAVEQEKEDLRDPDEPAAAA